MKRVEAVGTRKPYRDPDYISDPRNEPWDQKGGDKTERDISKTIQRKSENAKNEGVNTRNAETLPQQKREELKH